MPKPTPKKQTPLDLRSLCRTYTESNIAMLVALIHGKDTADDIKLRAISMLLERGWGRPQQELKTDSEIRVTIRKMLGDE
jgi:hypothetical protein